MKLAISNIAWEESLDTKMYSLLEQLGISGLEIAPTRVFPSDPYDHLREKREWSQWLYEKYGLMIPSMQSIWYGRTEQLFGEQTERNALIAYTKRAIDFAGAIGCGNLVFGCPKNRVVPAEMEAREREEIEQTFFGTLGEYAFQNGTTLSMEANPPMYQTNYINRTQEAVRLVRTIGCPGFQVNLDVGTMIANEESAAEVSDFVRDIHHVHMSEPGLALIEKRSLHGELLQGLRENSFDGFVSIEMGRRNNLEEVIRTLEYIKHLAEG